MIKSSERWIIRNRKTQICDRNGYTHIDLTLYTLQATKFHTKMIDLSNLFSDIMYQYKTSKSGSSARPWQKRQKASPYRVQRLAIKFSYKWLKFWNIGLYLTIRHEFSIEMVIDT
jgi:hypothetical protein